MNNPHAVVVAKTHWVWSNVTQEKHPDRVAGEPIWDMYLQTAPQSWLDAGYIEEAPYTQMGLTLDD